VLKTIATIAFLFLLGSAAPQAQQAASPYDSPDFVVPSNNIN